jgi:hypothetical protein
MAAVHADHVDDVLSEFVTDLAETVAVHAPEVFRESYLLEELAGLYLHGKDGDG